MKESRNPSQSVRYATKLLRLKISLLLFSGWLGLGCLTMAEAAPVAPQLTQNQERTQRAFTQRALNQGDLNQGDSSVALMTNDLVSDPPNFTLSTQSLPQPTNAPVESEEETEAPEIIPVTTTANPAVSSPTLPYCSEIATRRYAVLVNQPIESLPQLPEFLTIAAAPCQYFGILMTFFGTFDNAESVTLRSDQLRQLKLDAVVHSFKGDVSALNRTYRAYSVIVEMGTNPNNTVQQLQSLRFSPQKANLGNRQVLVVSPSSSLAPARLVANNLRARGLATQVISAALLNRNLFPSGEPDRSNNTASSSNSANSTATNTNRRPNNPNNPANNSGKPNSTGKPNNRNTAAASSNANNAGLEPIPPLPQGKVYRLLIPMRNADTLAQARAIAADAFPRTIKGRKLIQVRSYTDRENVTRERNRFNERFPGTIVIIE